MSLVPLFWQSDYLGIQSDTGFFAGISHAGVYEEGRDHSVFRTWACFDFSGDVLKSPCRATFGGFWTVAAEEFESDVAVCIVELKFRHPNKTILFYLPPNDEASAEVSSQIEVLLQLGGTIDFEDKNYMIQVDDWTPTNLSKGNKKKLRQWNESKGQVEKTTVHLLPEIYEIIRVNRLSLGVKPSISLVDLTKLANRFQNEYEFYVATINGDMAAVAVTVQSRSRSKYVFFWADSKEFRHLSPVVALCVHLLEVCKQQSRQFLDLGIATDEGSANAGLIRFKQNLGAIESRKYQISFKP